MRNKIDDPDRELKNIDFQNGQTLLKSLSKSRAISAEMALNFIDLALNSRTSNNNYFYIKKNT